MGVSQLPDDPADLAETFDASCWGDDGGRSVAAPLLDECAAGVFPESLTLLRTCLQVQSRLVRILTQDDDASDEVALRDHLADAVRERVELGLIDDDSIVVAHRLAAPHSPIAARVYEDPSGQASKSLLLGLMGQATSPSQQPVENQLSEVLAFLIDRSASFARGFLRLCDAGRDGDLRDAVAAATVIGARTRISLPAPGPDGLPQRTILFPDISIDGGDLAFQVLVEVKVDADLHRTTIAGRTLAQPDAYAHAWRFVDEPTSPKIRRVCTLTRTPIASDQDPWRRASLTWREVGSLLDAEIQSRHTPDLTVISSDLRNLINTIVYPPVVDPDDFVYVSSIGAIVSRITGIPHMRSRKFPTLRAG